MDLKKNLMFEKKIMLQSKAQKNPTSKDLNEVTRFYVFVIGKKNSKTKNKRLRKAMKSGALVACASPRL